MSTHPSLKKGSVSSKHQSVLKRLERLLHLKKQDKWNDGDSIFGLPKVKILKFKIKKEKSKVAEDAAATGDAKAEGAAPEQKSDNAASKDTGKAASKDAGKK